MKATNCWMWRRMCVYAGIQVCACSLQAGDFTCTTNKDGTLCITRYSGPGGDVVIPAEMDGKAVTTIGKSAFQRAAAVTRVVLPNSVTAIEDGSLSSVGGDWSWVSWPLGACPSGAFAGCTNLSKVILGPGLTNIGHFAFAYCPALVEITLPDSVTRIGDGAFARCLGLKSVSIGPGVTVIGKQAFDRCESLEQVQLGANVTVVGDWAFQSCASLESIEISDSVTAIGHGAFRDCRSLKKAGVGKNVTTIGRLAFSRCPALKEIYFRGNAPGEADPNLFFWSTNATVYYLSQTQGWPDTWAGRRTCARKE